MEEYLLVFPVLWQIEGSAIRTCIIVGFADIRGIVFKGRTPSIADVLVNLVAIAIQLKESWYREIHPFRVVELQAEEIFGCILVILHEIESPHALHGEES